jgi:hypothetical protein
MDATKSGRIEDEMVTVRTGRAPLAVVMLLMAIVIAGAILWTAVERPTGPAAMARTTLAPAVAVADDSRATAIHEATGRVLGDLARAEAGDRQPVPICIPCVARAAFIGGQTR